MCTECNALFFLSPVKSGLVAFSFLVSIAALVMFRRLRAASVRKRLSMLYIHIFAFIFPFLFFAFFRGCQNYFSGCGQAKAVITMLALTAGIATLIALAIAPIIFIKRQAGKSILLEGSCWNRFIAQHVPLNRKQPMLHIVDTAAPVAFSASVVAPRIFLSAGLFEILRKREIEAILLHEIAHIASRASVVRLSQYFARLLSPFAVLAGFLNDDVSRDEISADAFAVSVQGTSRFLDSAKVKIIRYNSERCR